MAEGNFLTLVISQNIALIGILLPLFAVLSYYFGLMVNSDGVTSKHKIYKYVTGSAYLLIFVVFPLACTYTFFLEGDRLARFLGGQWALTSTLFTTIIPILLSLVSCLVAMYLARIESKIDVEAWKAAKLLASNFFCLSALFWSIHANMPMALIGFLFIVSLVVLTQNAQNFGESSE